MVKKLLSIMFLLAPLSLFAQQQLSGGVFDMDAPSKRLEKVVVRNIKSNAMTFTDKMGLFTIPAKLGDLLEFSLLGYKTDTIFVSDMKTRDVRLRIQSIQLNEVKIRDAKISPNAVYKDPNARATHQVMTTPEKGGGLALGLGFGAYRRKQKQERELSERMKIMDQINSKFNAEIVGNMLPLKGQELTNFLDLYRPTVERIKDAPDFNYTYYIIESYRAFNKLPPDQRKLPALPKIPPRND